MQLTQNYGELLFVLRKIKKCDIYLNLNEA